MVYAFYITNHGFGHASRNVSVIRELLKRNPKATIVIKTDSVRVEFLKRNLSDLEEKIQYYDDVTEVGLVLKEGQMVPDISKMKQMIEEDVLKWGKYIALEEQFIKENHIDVVISDIVPWAIKAGKNCGVKTILISNFTWALSYMSYYEEEIWKPYLECYQMADKALWYEIHSEKLHEQNENYQCISLISREIDYAEVERIKAKYKKPIVFVSLGGSAELEQEIQVGHLPYDFLVTRGLKLKGDNVFELPLNMINTPDYIAASKYVVAKGGWSTIAEIMLQKKKCALLMRGDNLEDIANKEILEKREHCITLNGDDLKDMGMLLEKIESLKPSSYDMYHNDVKTICDEIEKLAI